MKEQPLGPNPSRQRRSVAAEPGHFANDASASSATHSGEVEGVCATRSGGMQGERLSRRERYRALVSLLIIPLGMIIVVRAMMVGVQAWTLIVLGLAFVGLGVVRLRVYVQQVHAQGVTTSRRKRV